MSDLGPIVDLRLELTKTQKELETALTEGGEAEKRAFEHGWNMCSDSLLTDRCPDDMKMAREHYLITVSTLQQCDHKTAPDYEKWQNVCKKCGERFNAA